MIFKHFQGGYWIFYLLTLVGHGLFGQDSIPSKLPNFLEFELENDFNYLRLPSDRYYTSGLSLRLQSDAFVAGPIGFGSLFPFRFQDKGAENYYQLQIVHQLFSPFNISWSDPSTMDRPYAALARLRIENQTVFSQRSFLLKKSIQLGWVGPALQGETSQNNYHQLIGRPKAQGWTYQIADQLVYGLNFGLEKGFSTKHWDQDTQSRWLLEINSEWSNLKAIVEVGLHYQLGSSQAYFAPRPLLHHRLQWYVYFKGFVQTIAYNQLINGPLSPSSDGEFLRPKPLHHLLLRGDYGIVLQQKKWECRLSQQFLSPELVDASTHYWGSISLRRYF